MKILIELKKMIDSIGNKSELCRKFGVAQRSLYRLINPKSGNPRLSTLLKLLDAIGCDLKITKKSKKNID